MKVTAFPRGRSLTRKHQPPFEAAIGPEYFPRLLPAIQIVLRYSMARYRCCFLNEDGQVARVEELTGYDDGDARRGVMSLLVRIGQFSGYELWRDGRKVHEYRPVSRPLPA
jgi:hypothetical protein